MQLSKPSNLAVPAACQDHGGSCSEHGPSRRPLRSPRSNTTHPVTIPSRTPHPATAATATAPVPEAPPPRWSLTNRLFGLSLRGLPPAAGPPRPPASRLWNPQNSSPRAPPSPARHHLQHRPPHRPPHHAPPPSAPREPNVPVERPHSARDEYPLLTLPQRRQSRQSPASSSLLVERSTAGDDLIASGRTSIGLPRDQARGRPSLQHDDDARPPTPGPSMAVAPAAAPQQVDHRDLEAAVRSPSAPQGGRASLPESARTSLSRSRSQRSHADGDDASEFPWGPSHPCFPHPNPHVPLNSELYDTTKIIRIKRDWMVKGDLAPTFANLYPEILDPLVAEDDFRELIKKINDSLVAAFDPFTFRAWLDSVLGVATFWLWDDVGMSGVKRQLNELESWIERWNREVGEKEAVKIIPLRRTGYLTVGHCAPYAKFTITDSHDSLISKFQTRISALTTAQDRGQTREKTISETPSARRTKSTGTTPSHQLYRSTPCRRQSRASRDPGRRLRTPSTLPAHGHTTSCVAEGICILVCSAASWSRIRLYIRLAA